MSFNITLFPKERGKKKTLQIGESRCYRLFFWVFHRNIFRDFLGGCRFSFWLFPPGEEQGKDDLEWRSNNQNEPQLLRLGAEEGEMETEAKKKTP